MGKHVVTALYRLVRFERLSGREGRALIAGPGIQAGVWYPVDGSDAAAMLLESLNLTYLHAMELTRSRAARRRPKRNVK